MKIFITGGTGLLGSNIIKILNNKKHKVINSFYGKSPEMNASVETCEMNLMDFDDIDKNLRKYMPDVLIHCAAAIDKKEIELGKDNAWKNMVEGTKVLATTARDINCSFVFISSDWVFDGTSKLINETSVPFPVNFYGVMKLVSEREIAAIENLHYSICRVAALYGINYQIPGNTRSVQTLGWSDLVTYYIKCILHKKPLHVWEGENVNYIAAPTYSLDAAKMISIVAENNYSGTFHTFTNESINRLDLAYKVKSIYKSDLPVYITNPDQIIIDEHFNVNVPYACVTDNSYTYNKLKYDCSINSGITEFKKELEKVKLNKYKLLDNSYYGY